MSNHPTPLLTNVIVRKKRSDKADHTGDLKTHICPFCPKKNGQPRAFRKIKSHIKSLHKHEVRSKAREKEVFSALEEVVSKVIEGPCNTDDDAHSAGDAEKTKEVPTKVEVAPAKEDPLMKEGVGEGDKVKEALEEPCVGEGTKVKCSRTVTVAELLGSSGEDFNNPNFGSPRKVKPAKQKTSKQKPFDSSDEDFDEKPRFPRKVAKTNKSLQWNTVVHNTELEKLVQNQRTVQEVVENRCKVSDVLGKMNEKVSSLIRSELDTPAQDNDKNKSSQSISDVEMKSDNENGDQETMTTDECGIEEKAVSDENRSNESVSSLSTPASSDNDELPPLGNGSDDEQLKHVSSDSDISEEEKTENTGPSFTSEDSSSEQEEKEDIIDLVSFSESSESEKSDDETGTEDEEKHDESRFGPSSSGDIENEKNRETNGVNEVSEHIRQHTASTVVDCPCCSSKLEFTLSVRSVDDTGHKHTVHVEQAEQQNKQAKQMSHVEMMQDFETYITSVKGGLKSQQNVTNVRHIFGVLGDEMVVVDSVSKYVTVEYNKASASLHPRLCSLNLYLKYILEQDKKMEVTFVEKVRDLLNCIPNMLKVAAKAKVVANATHQNKKAKKLLTSSFKDIVTVSDEKLEKILHRHKHNLNELPGRPEFTQARDTLITRIIQEDGNRSSMYTHLVIDNVEELVLNGDTIVIAAVSPKTKKTHQISVEKKTSEYLVKFVKRLLFPMLRARNLVPTKRQEIFTTYGGERLSASFTAKIFRKQSGGEMSIAEFRSKLETAGRRHPEHSQNLDELARHLDHDRKTADRYYDVEQGVRNATSAHRMIKELRQCKEADNGLVTFKTGLLEEEQPGESQEPTNTKAKPEDANQGLFFTQKGRLFSIKTSKEIQKKVLLTTCKNIKDGDHVTKSDVLKSFVVDNGTIVVRKKTYTLSQVAEHFKTLRRACHPPSGTPAKK